jgi:hypothetical protein
VPDEVQKAFMEAGFLVDEKRELKVSSDLPFSSSPAY